MSQPVYQLAKQKDLSIRQIPLDTFITPDNNQILLTKATVRTVANKISQEINRKLTQNEIQNLISFISTLPPSKYSNMTIEKAYDVLTEGYLNRNFIKKEIQKSELSTNVVKLTRLEEITDDPTIDDYQRKEIEQLTKDENINKYSAFANRRGNAVVDANRTIGNYSSPDSVPPSKKISTDDMNIINHEALKMVKKFLDPDSINQLLGRFSNAYTTFFSINLPHQTIPIDSRNRNLGNTSPTEYTWVIHSAGNTGAMGSIKIQDTLQQVIQIGVGNFYLPMYPLVGSYYGKIRMLIKEFSAQSNYYTQFFTNNTNEGSMNYYHFDFEISSTVGNRAFLTPINKYFTFRKPIAQVDTVTISFSTPFDQYIFPPDRGTYTVTAASNPAIFTITSSVATTLATGDLIYVLNFNSANAALNNEMTRQIGYVITVTSPTTFTIPVDASALAADETGVNVYYGSRRIFFPLEFLSLEQ